MLNSTKSHRHILILSSINCNNFISSFAPWSFLEGVFLNKNAVHSPVGVAVSRRLSNPRLRWGDIDRCVEDDAPPLMVAPTLPRDLVIGNRWLGGAYCLARKKPFTPAKRNPADCNIHDIAMVVLIIGSNERCDIMIGTEWNARFDEGRMGDRDTEETNRPTISADCRYWRDYLELHQSNLFRRSSRMLVKWCDLGVGHTTMLLMAQGCWWITTSIKDGNHACRVNGILIWKFQILWQEGFRSNKKNAHMGDDVNLPPSFFLSSQFGISLGKGIFFLNSM